MRVKSVTVGIVVFNTNFEIFEKTIQSLVAQSIPMRIIVLCNSQSPSYQNRIEAVCSRIGVEFLRDMPNRGFGAGHNAIVTHVHSEWYVCCNPDVLVASDAIQNLVEFGASHEDAILLAPRVNYPDGRVQPLSRRHLTLSSWVHRQAWRLLPSVFRPFEIRFDYEKTQPVEFVSGCFFMVSTKRFLELGGFDESFFLYCEDAELSLRASLVGQNYFVSEAKIAHEWSTNLKTDRTALRREILSLMRLFLKRFQCWLKMRNAQSGSLLNKRERG